jgi:predicted TIM-barrel fold metal-dependent hydrolase
MRIVDVHAHYYPKEYLTLLERVIRNDSTVWGRAVQQLYATRLTANPRMTDISAHIDDMDAAGVEMHALSMSIPHVYFDDPNDAAEAARIVNDSLAELVAKYPTRFKGLAILPLPHTDAALKELDRAINTLGLHGAALGGNVRGAGLDDERFLPIYEQMNRLNLMVHLHPVIPPGQEEMEDYGMAAALGYLLDTAVGVLRLAQGGVLDANPNIKFIAPHLGTMLVAAWDRINNPRPEPMRGMKKSLAEHLHAIYYDSVNLHRPAWDCALQTIDVDHIVFGSDYPFVPQNSTDRTIALINGLDLSELQKEAIFHGTADTLLR